MDRHNTVNGFAERAHWGSVEAALALYREGKKVNFVQSFARYDRAPGPAAPGATALDVCCGSGQGSIILADKGYRVYTFDKYPGAGAMLASHGVTFRCCAAADYEPPGGVRFDLITCCDALEHIREPGAALEKMREWIAPAGKLFLAVPVEGANKPPNPHHCNNWTKAGLCALIDEQWRRVEEFPPVNHAAYWVLCEPL